MSKRDNLMLSEDMLEAADKIISYVQGDHLSDFLGDEKTKDAVIRNFEIIGEAAARLDTDFKDSHKEVPWSQLKGYRNRLIHEYFGVDYEIVFEIIQNDLPTLSKQLQNLLRNK